MKLWMIKIGKAFSALRREGLIRGGSRVLKSFFAMFRRVGEGDVLIVTGGLGDSALYRAWHVAEELSFHGIPTAVSVQDNPFLFRYADRFSVFVFHRTMYTPSIARLMKRVKALGKTMIYETDDLVFDAKYFAHMDHFRNMNFFERKQYAGGVGAEILADEGVDACTTTTSFLAEKLRDRGKRVFVVKNKLSKEDVRILEACFSDREKRDASDRVVIGYFSGAKGHDKDFATVAPVLARLLGSYSNVSLFLAGPLEVGAELNPHKERIQRFPYVPREEHFRNVASVDINIAPLEVGNPFCEGKSELKFFEAGMLGIPTVAAATQTFREAITDEKDGFLAVTNEEWEDYLRRLIENAELRRSIGRAARLTAKEKYVTTADDNLEYYAFLRERIALKSKKETE